MLLGDPNEFWGKWTPFKMAKSVFKHPIWDGIHHLTRAHKILLLGKGNDKWKFSWEPLFCKQKNSYDIKEMSKEMLNSVERVKSV